MNVRPKEIQGVVPTTGRHVPCMFVELLDLIKKTKNETEMCF